MLAMQAAAEPPPGAEFLEPSFSTKERRELLTKGPSLLLPVQYLHR